MGINEEENAKTPRWQQVLYFLAPFFLLSACFGLINFIPAKLTAVTTATPQSGNETTLVTAISPTSTPDSFSIAAISPTPATIPTATLPPDAVIELLGPPAGSSFRRNDTISFFADWSSPLTESQQLAAYIRINDQPPILLGVLEEPNIGQRYRWQTNIGEVAGTAVSLEWWVQLQTSRTASPLLTSASRPVTLLP